MQKHSDDNYTGQERRSHTCSEHGEVASISGKLNVIAALFVTLLGLIGYNIHTTQQIQVQVAEQIATLGGQINNTNIRARASDDLIHENRVILNDHEQRIRYLEKNRR